MYCIVPYRSTLSNRHYRELGTSELLSTLDMWTMQLELSMELANCLQAFTLPVHYAYTMYHIVPYRSTLSDIHAHPFLWDLSSLSKSSVAVKSNVIR